MLSGYQTEIIAFYTDGAILCYDCARKRIGNDVYMSRIERGLDEHPALEPMCRYAVEESFGCTCDAEGGEHEDSCYGGAYCDDCMEEIS